MVHIDTLTNGLTVIIEEMPHFESVAYDLHIPGGIITDHKDKIGTALTLTELTQRGAGDRNSRELSDAYDALGVRHSSSAGTDRFVYRGTLLAPTLPTALQLLSDQVQRPRLPAEEVQSILDLLLMDLRSVPDNPSRMTMIELSKRFLPPPYNRPSLIDEGAIPALDGGFLAEAWRSLFSPHGAILSIAGNCTKREVLPLIQEIFSSWKSPAVSLPSFTEMPPRFNHHISQESAQVQICLAYISAKFGDQHYYTAKVANEILSGGMFGRLFIEVREKRGLCYSVHSRHSSGRYVGSVTAYAGTTPDRAHETLTVMLSVLKGLSDAISPEEMARAKANLKASLIIGEESPGSRASSNAGDYWLLQRVRTLDEVAAAIDSVTEEDIAQYVTRYSPDTYSLVTLGSKEIQ